MSVIKTALQHPEQIAYLSGASNYTWLHYGNGEKKLLAKPISYLERILPTFIRVHKTALINPAYVDSLHQPPRQKMAGAVHLKSGEVLPVGRRRWQQVAETLAFGHGADCKPARDAAVPYLAPAFVLNSYSAISILLISDDESQSALARAAIEKKWPHHTFHQTGQINYLTTWLNQLAEEEYPALILIDARNYTLERLNLLQRLKNSRSFCRIPIVLFVNLKDQAVTEGYKRQANSVISMMDDYPYFARAVEQICQFWLGIAALPGSVSSESRRN